MPPLSSDSAFSYKFSRVLILKSILSTKWVGRNLLVQKLMVLKFKIISRDVAMDGLVHK